jgi:hypothetical protein
MNTILLYRRFLNACLYKCSALHVQRRREANTIQFQLHVAEKVGEVPIGMDVKTSGSSICHTRGNTSLISSSVTVKLPRSSVWYDARSSSLV